MKRQKLRRYAFLILFGMAVSEDPPKEAMENYFEAFREDYIKKDGDFNAGDLEFLEDIVNGVYDHMPEIDGKISKYSDGYEISRIAKVAVTALRISVYEMFYRSDIPVNVSINEAIEIVKIYEDEKMRKFVNGILGSIAAEIEK